MSDYNHTSNDVIRARVSQNTITGSVAIRVNQAGQEFNIATDALTITLPKIETDNIGMEFLFRNTGADANNIMTLSPNAADAFHGTVAAVQASGALDKDWINTKATALKGDWVKIKAIALTDWYITGGDGVWASQS